MAVSRLASAPGIASGTVTSAVTTSADLPAELITTLPGSSDNLAFLSGDDGLVGFGEHAALRVSGPDAAARIQDWFTRQVAGLQVSDQIGRPGTGPVVFVSLGFDSDDESVAVIPSVLLGRRGGVTWRTVIGRPAPTSPVEVRSPGAITWTDPAPAVNGFRAAVGAATERIRRGELDKVVLAHDLQATAERDIDDRHLLGRLSPAYPTCWTFAVAGLVGASPEMLVHRFGRALSSRVLAGTAWAEGLGNHVAERLMTSEKNLAEHAFAVASVAASLQPVAQLDVPAGPRPLVLTNLTHLATEVSGDLRAESSDTALELAARLHPTAAVGGTPTPAALELIRELEPTRRGRYAGPVGWLDARGDGEFALALRCAQITGRSLRLMAGCGIVADSDPQVEAREAQVKMIPIQEALLP